MNKIRWILLFSSLVLAPLVASGQDFAQKAATAFDQGQYDEAAKIYAAAAAQGTVNGHLYYNLGIAAYRQSQVGEAMAAFLAARRYLPRDPDVAANLRFVESRIKDRLDSRLAAQETGPFGFWYRLAPALSVKELAYATTALLTLWALVVSLGLLWPRARALLPAAWYALLLPAVPAALLLTAATMGSQWGAVIDTSGAGAKVHSGPSIRESVLFELHEGAPVLVRGPLREGFWPVELSDGKKGWISSDKMRVWL